MRDAARARELEVTRQRRWSILLIAASAGLLVAVFAENWRLALEAIALVACICAPGAMVAAVSYNKGRFVRSSSTPMSSQRHTALPYLPKQVIGSGHRGWQYMTTFPLASWQRW